MTKEELPALLAEIERSGESVAALARRRGLSTWKLYRSRGASAGSRPRQHRSKPAELVPVRVVPPVGAAPLELALAGCHVLRIPAGFDEAELRRLLGVLAGC